MGDMKPIAQEVREAVERIRAADPDAYSGYITDAACHAVAARRNLKATEVVRLYRSRYPVKGMSIPSGAKRPAPEAAALA